MAYRRKMSKRWSRKQFSRGARGRHRKNARKSFTMRGGKRL